VSERIFLFSLLFAFSNCTIFDNEKRDFGFISIDKFILEDNQLKILPSKITDVWIYADDQFLGVYPLPITIPVPLSGKSIRFSIRAGIEPNGQNESGEEYPFFSTLDTTINFSPEETVKVTPRVKYKPNCKFDIIEDFELGNIFTVGIGNSAQSSCLTRTLSSGLSSSFGGVMDLNSSQKQCETTHFATFSNQNNLLGKVFLEMDYKSGEKFFVGTILQKGGQLVKSYDIVIVESDIWNRIYIDLTDKISKTDVQNYQIAISALLDESKRSQARISLDNIRLIHF
jgi:hypothetical protein